MYKRIATKSRASCVQKNSPVKTREKSSGIIMSTTKGRQKKPNICYEEDVEVVRKQNKKKEVVKGRE